MSDSSSAGPAVLGASAIPEVLGELAQHTVGLIVSENAYLGNAQFVISIDGIFLGYVMTATSLHPQPGTPFVLPVTIQTGSHTIGVFFLNDLYGGTGKDRNLWITGLTVDGVAVPGFSGFEVGSTGLHTFTITLD